MRGLLRQLLMIPLTGLLLRAVESETHGCSVCFGDPASPMAKGALMGVLTLGGVIATVLVMIAGTGAFWLHRSIKLSRSSNPPDDFNQPD